MIISATSVCVVLLGALCLTNSAPSPVQGELYGAILTAEILYKELSKVASEYEAPQSCQCPPNTNVVPPNNEGPIAINGRNNLNFPEDVYGLRITGK